MTVVPQDDAYQPEEDDHPVPLTQAELNDLTQDPNLSKKSAQLLGSCLKEKQLLGPGITIYRDWERKREFRQFLMFQDKTTLVYCNNIAGLIKSMGIEYDATEWRLFINSPCRSLKAVPLHNESSFPSIPIEHSAQTKETHNSINHLLPAVNYQEYKWLILRWLDWSMDSKLGTQCILVFCVSGTNRLMTNIMSDKSGCSDKG